MVHTISFRIRQSRRWLFLLFLIPSLVLAADKIDINLATIDDLKTIPGMTDSFAEMILYQRQQLGSYASMQQMLYIPGMTPEAVDKVGRGHVWSGRKALDLGLVDKLGGLDDAVKVAATRAKLGEDYKVRFIEKELGWKQKLAFSVAIMHEPAIVFLDEPTSGVDPVTRRQFWDMIYEAAHEGITVFLTTHYMDEAEYCERVSIMVDGRIEALDTPAGLKRQFNVESMEEVFIRLARK